MKCKFCGAEVELGERCEYCGSRAEKEYYHTQETQEKKRKAPQRQQKPAAHTYTVKAGDNLWNIAKMMYGSGAEYDRIVRKNKIENPNLIYPGQVLKI